MQILTCSEDFANSVVVAQLSLGSADEVRGADTCVCRLSNGYFLRGVGCAKVKMSEKQNKTNALLTFGHLSICYLVNSNI